MRVHGKISGNGRLVIFTIIGIKAGGFWKRTRQQPVLEIIKSFFADAQADGSRRRQRRPGQGLFAGAAGALSSVFPARPLFRKKVVWRYPASKAGSLLSRPGQNALSG